MLNVRLPNKESELEQGTFVSKYYLPSKNITSHPCQRPKSLTEVHILSASVASLIM